MRSKIYIFLFLLQCLGIGKISAQQISFYYKGAWSAWTSPYNASFFEKSIVQRYTDMSGCLLITDPGQITFLNFKINNYSLPSKKEIKRHWKAKEWYTYTGIVEYYVNDQYPTAEALAKNERLVYPNPRKDQTPNVKRTATATIKIQPFKKEPEVFNVWFDNIGIGFSIQGLKFGK